MAKHLLRLMDLSEKEITEILNLAAEALIQGSNSLNEAEVRKLMIENGLSEDEARKKVISANALDVFWAGYGGFISGSVSSANLFSIIYIVRSR